MSDDHKSNTIQELESIIRLLADVWPTDRENLAEAGARFEKVIEGMDQNFGQLQKLINLSWEGLKHLYEKDDFFMTVKASTMQAVNTVREYIIQDGNIKVEDFENAYSDLEKSLSGGSESADEVIELDDETMDGKQADVEQTASVDNGKSERAESLDDLAALIMTMDEESASRKDKAKLGALMETLAGKESEDVAKHLKKGLGIMVKAIKEEDYEGWLGEISGLTEAAINEEGEDQDESKSASETETALSEEGEKREDRAEDSFGDEAFKVFIIPDDIELEMVGEFVTECSDLIQMAESALLDLEESPGDEELINTIFRSFHTIKGTSAFMGLDPISEFTHNVETFLSMVREGDLSFDRACADISFDSIDIITKMLAKVETISPGDKLDIPPMFTPMMRVLEEISEEGKSPADALAEEEKNLQKAAEKVLQKEVPANGVAKAAADGTTKQSEPADGNTAKNESEASVRVSVNRLDRLIDMVGELVIAHSVVAQDEAIPQDSDLHKKVNHATKILRELQDTSLTLRMVPMKATFHKMNRLVRDLSRKAGKKVKFTTVGEDTEIDRNMVDIINEPLIHMIRNALDHGIETTEERTKTGKEETAHIELTASQEGGKVVIKIKDDGRGINKDIILRKATEKGLVDPDKKMSDKEIYNLIFLPGFSSAEKVTDLSGRGVGMDVVRRSIEQLQGKVEVESELGAGTTITIELPFTLAITDGMVVRVGGDRFIVPTINIDMTFRAESNEVFTVMGESEQVSFRGKSVPVIRLHRLFEMNGAIEELSEGTLLVIKNNNKRYALLVDEVIGQQQLVGKSINMLVKMDHISGGAIMGDGRVGLILDTAALVEKQ